MPSIRNGMLLTVGGHGGHRVAYNMVFGQLARGSKLSFVYDFVAGAGDFSASKFTLDAARKPLRGDLDEDEFKAMYGVSRFLRFKPAAPRKAWQYDVWSDLYA